MRIDRGTAQASETKRDGDDAGNDDRKSERRSSRRDDNERERRSKKRKGRQIRRTICLDAVEHVDALYVDSRKHAEQWAPAAISADDEASLKREMVHRRLSHSGKARINHCVEWKDLSELKVGKRDQLLDDKCEICIMAKQVKKQSRVPIPRTRRLLQRVNMGFWGLARWKLLEHGHLMRRLASAIGSTP